MILKLKLNTLTIGIGIKQLLSQKHDIHSQNIQSQDWELNPEPPANNIATYAAEVVPKTYFVTSSKGNKPSYSTNKLCI